MIESSGDPRPKKIDSGLARGVEAGLRGEEVSFSAVLETVGGVRGVFEALLPGLMYLLFYIFTEDIKISVIAPVVISIVFILLRLISRKQVIPALSGFFGVLIAVFATLFTGKGESYFVPGFWINGAWVVVLLLSVVLRFPLIGLVVGFIQSDLKAWRENKKIMLVAYIATFGWLALFVMRLVVQLPLFYAGDVASLGVARLVMGTPLFAMLVIFTWLLFRRMGPSKQAEQE